MMEYIKKLCACIKWLFEREDANLGGSVVSLRLQRNNTPRSWLT
ncbi:hypothetical protein ACP70R_033064 [Stipagrostis hirtigluma subsp. patula]